MCAEKERGNGTGPLVGRVGGGSATACGQRRQIDGDQGPKNRHRSYRSYSETRCHPQPVAFSMLSGTSATGSESQRQLRDPELRCVWREGENSFSLRNTKYQVPKVFKFAQCFLHWPQLRLHLWLRVQVGAWRHSPQLGRGRLCVLWGSRPRRPLLVRGARACSH